MARPSNFPPPFSARDYVAEPTDPADERIEVGVLVVGAGPAGLACAIRLGQLLEEHPEMAERFGEVPVAVLEKGKQPGSHLLSGAVVNPRALRRLFGDRFRMRGPAVVRPGPRGVGLRPHPPVRAPDPAAAADAQPRQLDLLALASSAASSPSRRRRAAR